MNPKISNFLGKIISSKGLTHEEEQIVQEYKCTSEELNRFQNTRSYTSPPKEDPNGDAVYIKKQKVIVEDDLSEREVDLLLQVNHDEHLESIDTGLKRSFITLIEKLDIMEEHLKIMKYCIMGFAILTAISVILSIVSASIMASLN